MYLHDWRTLKKQIVERIRECVMPCPTTAVFDFLPGATRRIKVGRSLRLFGDGYQKRDEMFGRTVWRIPVTEGEFIVEETMGVRKAVAGGMFLIFAENQKAGLLAAEKASETIRTIEDVILTFPGGICRSGSKVGSAKYPRMKASTNEQYSGDFQETITSTIKNYHLVDPEDQSIDYHMEPERRFPRKGSHLTFKRSIEEFSVLS